MRGIREAIEETLSSLSSTYHLKRIKIDEECIMLDILIIPSKTFDVTDAMCIVYHIDEKLENILEDTEVYDYDYYWEVINFEGCKVYLTIWYYLKHKELISSNSKS